MGIFGNGIYCGLYASIILPDFVTWRHDLHGGGRYTEKCGGRDLAL